jgi:hypothetical protein
MSRGNTNFKMVTRRAASAMVVGAIVLASAACSAAEAAGDANQATCAAFTGTEASPGFRSYLPDCRAYELVTPPYKGGQPALGFENQPPVLAASGDRALGLDFSGFAGTENEEDQPDELGAVYEFSRSQDGWTSDALEPPAALASRRHFVTASADLSRTLWGLINQDAVGPGEEVQEPRGEGSEYDFAVRESSDAGPRFATVGPEDPPGSPPEQASVGEQAERFEGASADLSHILFTLPTASGTVLWPGDTTKEGDPSLYEYVGDNNREPVLVGVKNSGALAGTAHRNEHAELVSTCGTSLGSQRFVGTTYNAVSADGTRVDFTAGGCGEGAPSTEGPEADELYARVNGDETIDLSEPSGAQCAECKTPPTITLGRRSAQFQGASEDGSKVFFLSEQELLPGAKGESLYEYDFDAAAGAHVILVAPEAIGVGRISEDGSHAYFVSRETLTLAPDLSLRSGHQTAIAGEPNLYVFNSLTGHTAFVATLGAGDEEVWKHRDHFRRVETTPNGQLLTFVSEAQLTPDDTGTVRQIFEYDADSERLERVTIGQRTPASPTGYGDDGNTMNEEMAPTMLRTQRYEFSDQPTERNQGVSLATNGAVVFTSRDALTRGAVADGAVAESGAQASALQNIYEYREGNVYLISPADQSAPLVIELSRLLGISESGANVFFFTTDRLVGQDVDSQASWYDAREAGGFPAPAASAECASELCQGVPSPTPSLPTPGGSAAVQSGDNLAPPPVAKSSTSASRPKKATRAQLLERALKACAKRPKYQRAGCVKQARKRYAPRRAPAKRKRKQ